MDRLIDAELERRNISLRQLAYIAGVDHSTLSKIARGMQAASPRTIRKLAPTFGMPPEDLLRMAGHPERGDRGARRIPQYRPPRTVKDLLEQVQRALPIEVPIYDQLVGGQPGTDEREDVIYWPVKAEAGPYLVATEMREDCWHPQISSGDLVVIDTREPRYPANQVIAVTEQDGPLFIRRWVRRDGDAYLEAPNCTPMLKDRRFIVYGTVVQVIKNTLPLIESTGDSSATMRTGTQD